MLLLIASGFAQVVATGPFSGEISEGFEGFALTATPVACLDPVLGGTADICAPDASVGGIQVRDTLFLGCLLDARSGAVMAGSNDGASEIRFDTPVDRFGGYMATHADNGDVTLEAYDGSGTLIGSVTEPLGGSCNWAWHGIAAVDVPFSSVRIIHSSHAGALVDLDDLEADTACGVGAIDADGDGMPSCVDCNDADPSVFPGAVDDCDGVDSDCNGVVDDSPPGAGLASNQAGVCAGSTLVCGPNSLVDPDYSLIPGYEADETTCDGLDNDCDGTVDDIAVAPMVSDVGICATIPQVCDGANGWVAPNPQDVQGYQSSETACDGIDNDCDGLIDNDLPPRPSQFIAGVCADQVQICAGVDGWQEPTEDPPGFGPEICDGIDNDCSGVIDDNCVEPSIFDKCGCQTADPRFALGSWALLALFALRRR